MSGLIQRLGEFKGKQELYQRQMPQMLETLRQTAIIESTESSNRIEGITVSRKRFRELMAHPNKPQDRSEAEILGYRKALAAIHARHDGFSIDKDTICLLHKQIYENTDIAGGQWKKRDNTIEEKLSDGRWITRFVPVSAREAPYYIEQLCIRFERLRHKSGISPLILIPAFVLDFLCIHPFSDGNGRVSRLLTVLLLNQENYYVGKFISLERLIEESKETYYEALNKSSESWHDSRHRLKPWFEYFLGVLIGAYKEFERRASDKMTTRGAKTALVEEAIRNMPSLFKISDVERNCPSVSRDMIRIIINRFRDEGLIKCKGTGRGAVWEKGGNKPLKHGNKHGNKEK